MKAYDIKKGNVVEHGGTVYQVRDIERSSPQGRGGNVRFRFVMYSIPGAQKLDASFDGDDDLREVDMSRRQATYSYKDGDAFVFLDDEDYTPYALEADVVGDMAGYVVPDLAGCYVQIIDDAPVGLQLPQSVAIEVVETPPELKGAAMGLYSLVGFSGGMLGPAVFGAALDIGGGHASNLAWVCGYAAIGAGCLLAPAAVRLFRPAR